MNERTNPRVSVSRDDEEAKVPDLIVLSQYFYPELISTGQLLTELVEDLIKGGRRIEVWAGHLTYYETKRVETVIDYRGVLIHRVWSTQFNKNRLLGKVLNQLTFMASMLLKTRTIARGTSVLVVTCPPLLPWIGVVAKFFGPSKVSVLIHDVYPNIAIATGHLKKHGLVARIFERMMTFVYQHADHIIVLGRDMRDIIINKYPSRLGDKVTIIENWSDGQLIRSIPKRDSAMARAEGLEKEFVVQYSGNMGLFHDLETLIHAAKQLEHEEVVFLFIGGGGQRQALEDLVDSIGARNVRFIAYQPKECIPDSLTCSDLSVVTLASGVEGLAVPSKLYGILASGRPVLAAVPQKSEVAYTVLEGDCGVVIPPSDVAACVAAIRQLKHDPELRERLGKNARALFENKYDRTIIARRYESLLFPGDEAEKAISSTSEVGLHQG